MGGFESISLHWNSTATQPFKSPTMGLGVNKFYSTNGSLLRTATADSGQILKKINK